MQPVKLNTDSLKYLTPENLYAEINQFTAGMAVTRGKFDLVIPQCTIEDIEWNHMDQMHRHAVHNTYEKGIRIACGREFALSLTQWRKWPLLIPVTDVHIGRGLFYQSLTIAGIIFLHSVVTMEEIPGADSIKLVHEWFIGSHKLFRFLHKIMNNKLHKLNIRLQSEDQKIRQGRFALRQQGYHFKTDKPDYYNSNKLTTNTIYPDLEDSAFVSINPIDESPTLLNAGSVDFIVKKIAHQTYHIWPAACPHEGGPLLAGKFCDAQISCPWHGLRFTAAELSPESPRDSRYGFDYQLVENKIYINKKRASTQETQESLTMLA